MSIQGRNAIQLEGGQIEPDGGIEMHSQRFWGDSDSSVRIPVGKKLHQMENNREFRVGKGKNKKCP
jgi:hypothetical protein